MQPWYWSQIRFTPGQTVNRALYKNILGRLRKRVQRVRKDIAGDWMLHHNNAPAYAALSIREFLTKKNIPTFPHPPYSQNLAPCDHFGTVKNIRKIVTDELRTLTNDLRYRYDQWKNVGTTVQLPKGCTLKEITCNFR
jgi:hypothetical protein